VDQTTTSIAKFAAGLSFDQIPSPAIRAAKQHLIDSIGCAFGGCYCPTATIGRRIAEGASPRLYRGQIFGSGKTTTAENAAFINSAMIRYLDFNDSVHGGHPSDTLGALLAVAGPMKLSGKEMLTAMIAAYEVIYRIIAASKMRERGWDQGFAIGVGTAAGHGNLLKLSPSQLANAVSIAAVANVPLRATRAGDLSLWKGAATAHACRDGVFAAQLAAQGMTGPEAPFEGRHGLFEQVTGKIEFTPFGSEYCTPSVGMKYWPVENTAQGGVWAALDLRQRMPVETIANIDIATSWASWHEIGSEPAKWDPRNRETADHSLPYIFARALVDGTIGVGTFAEDQYLDPSLRPIMAKIRVFEDPEISKLVPGTVINRITAKDLSGRIETIEIVNSRGHMKNVMDDDDTNAKFLRLTETIIGKLTASEVLDKLWHLETIPDASVLFELLDIPAAR
jgi:2-methylcitrate dehydratase